MASRRRPRRLIHYVTFALPDGTITGGYPDRKPARRIMKRDGFKADEDGVFKEYPVAARDVTQTEVDHRVRVLNLVCNRLNTRRSLRELVCKPLAEVANEIALLHAKIDRLEATIQAVVSKLDRLDQARSSTV